MNGNNIKKRNKGGRTPKSDPSIHRHVFRLTDRENAKLLALFEASGMTNKAKFIISILFGKEIKTVKIDKATWIIICDLPHCMVSFAPLG